MPKFTDTIAAIATPAGKGGIGIVRISGEGVARIASRLIGHLPEPRFAEFNEFRDSDNQPLDRGITLYFPGPNSFTGEDTLELQGHGGPVVLEMVLQRALEIGARLARPGEFSERAFLNGRIDLAQAEAIADLIDSSSCHAARSALRSLQGEFSQKIRSLQSELIKLRCYIEAALDFPDEEIDFLDDKDLRDSLRYCADTVDKLVIEARRGIVLTNGLSVAIAGQPNVGKSSILNRLARTDAAIVTELPGTTRDLIKVDINLDGLPLHVIDTAGIRLTAHPVEKEGIDRARRAISQADLLLLVKQYGAPTDPADEEILGSAGKRCKRVIVYNKIDLSGAEPEILNTRDSTKVSLSAKSGEGMELLEGFLKLSAGFTNLGEGTFSARARHLVALEQTASLLAEGLHRLQETGEGELVAEILRQGQKYLSEITGEYTTDNLLGEIFSSFCIGK